MPWLKAFDADIIYSYVDLTEAEQFRFHEDFYPSVLQRHWEPADDPFPRLEPQPALPALHVSSLIPLAGTASFLDGSRGITLATGMGAWWNDRFLGDSFGRISSQFRNALRGPLATYGTIIAAVQNNELQPRQQYFLDNETTVPDDTSIIYHMARNRRISGLSRLSSMMSQKLDVYSGRWRRSFNIVVSYGIDDRILYWNARAIMPNVSGLDDVDLCIPWQNFDRPDFVTQLREFMNNRAYVGGGNGPARATLRSISLEESDLTKLSKLMMEGQTWISFDHERVDNVQAVRPLDGELRNARFGGSDRAFRPSKQWSSQSFTGNSIEINSPAPEHLRHIPTSIANANLGAWALDVDIDRAVDHSPYSNVQHRWRLPRRLRVTGAFKGAYEIAEQNTPIVYPRASLEGYLTIFSSLGTPPQAIEIPSDERAIIHALCSGRDWPQFERFGDTKYIPEPISARAERSAAGRYFWGVYQLFGDLTSANSFLLNSFWRKQLEKLGATDQRTDARQVRIETMLRKRLNLRSFDAEDPEGLSKLANIVLQEADAERSSIRSLRWNALKDEFDIVIESYLSKHASETQDTDAGDPKIYYRRFLKSTVQDLCGLEVLHQGYEHTCSKCLHRFWTAISDLSPQITCEVCHSSKPAPVDGSWQFRLNGFLREALQRHGIGPLFWVLNHYRGRNSTSFWFEGPLNVFLDEKSAMENRPNTDIDLTMIEGGIVRMCEVKQSERQFTDPEGLAETMLKARPDVAIIAVMERESERLNAKFQRFAAKLEGSGVQPEMLTLDVERDFFDGPYFL